MYIKSCKDELTNISLYTDTSGYQHILFTTYIHVQFNNNNIYITIIIILYAQQINRYYICHNNTMTSQCVFIMHTHNTRDRLLTQAVII